MNLNDDEINLMISALSALDLFADQRLVHQFLEKSGHENPAQLLTDLDEKLREEG